MDITTKMFGDIAIDNSKIVEMPQGIVGFPSLRRFALLRNEERDGSVSWFQSLDEPGFFLPVMNPLAVKGDYSPSVDNDTLSSIGDFKEDDLLILVTLTIPHDNIEAMSVNLKAPIIINSASMKGCQIIAENEDYPIKYPIYEILKANKEET